MNTTTHPVAPEEVMAFLDGELAAEDAQAVSIHLEHCVECTALAEQFRGTSQSLSSWKVPAVPATLEKSAADFAAKAHSGLKIGKANIFIRASFWTWKQWAAGLGATAAVLVLLIAIGTSNRMRSASSGVIGGVGQPIGDQQSKALTDRVEALNTPGIAGDSNGMMHGLGDHAQNSISLDGQIAPMIARSVSLSIMAKDFVASRSSLDAILARHHGYSAQLNVSTPENAPRGLQASLRIPAPELSAAVADLKTLGRVENESQSGEEVTQQHADLVARLKNSRETEQRLQAILVQRTGKISDILQVEQEIARVRGEIEQMETDQKSLEHRVEFATVNLNLTEEYKAQLNAPAPSVSTRVHNSLVAGYRNAAESLLGVVLFFAEDGPIMVIWLGIIVVPVILLWRRYRRTLATT
jgi:predicted phage tail protein